jgi:hypothetical protein
MILYVHITVSLDIKKSGSITFQMSSTWRNPFLITLRSPVSPSGGFCNVTVAHMNFVLSHNKVGDSEDRSVTTTVDPSGTPMPQTLSAAGNAQAKAKLAGIIGGVLGGLMLIVLVGFLVWWRRRKASRRWDGANMSSTSNLTVAVTTMTSGEPGMGKS